jgi:ergothioneine biosynthesis protein EgtB
LRHILSRPSLDEVHAYRIYVDEAMVHLLTLEQPAAALDLIALGINHEQQHQELIVTDVKNGLWANPLRPAYRIKVEHVDAHAANPAPSLKWQSFPEGVYSAGFEGSGFAFDNEGPRHNVYLEAFRLASRLVTNGEYLEFMRDGGYSNPLLWFSDGWDCVRNNQWNAPLYWEQRDGEWWNYTVEGMQPVLLNEPVCHVSFYEADAFARWAGARLPSEFEWEVAARSCPSPAIFWSRARCIRNLQPRPSRWRRCSAMCGSGRRALTLRIPVFSPRRARLASTTASSCATRWCCAAARARRRNRTCGPPIAISFRPVRAGSSWG